MTTGPIASVVPPALPWFAEAFCAVCRRPLGVCHALAIGLPGGVVFVHERCAARSREEVTCR